MTKKLFSVVSLISEDSELGRMLELMRETLRKGNVSFQNPKMGDHITYLPPFLAPKDFGYGFSKALKFGQRQETLQVAGTRFLDSDKRALAVLLKPTEHLRKIVEELRISIERSWWKFPPERYPFLMHATAAETMDGESSFYQKIKKLRRGQRPEDVVTQITINTPLIYIMEKHDVRKGWAPVHF